MVLDVIQIKGWSHTRHFSQHNQGLDNYQAHLIRHSEKIRLPANRHPSSYMGHQFFRHVIG